MPLTAHDVSIKGDERDFNRSDIAKRRYTSYAIVCT